MSTASCLKCRGVFDATYCHHTRAGMCPACMSFARAKRTNARCQELLDKGYHISDALRNSREFGCHTP